MPTDLIKCPCLHCGGSIEFDADAAGQEFDCPHCQKKTWVDVPGKMNYLPPKARNQINPPMIPPSMVRRDRLVECRDCLKPIGMNAVICPHCGTLPSLGRIGWYVFVITSITGFILMFFWVILIVAMSALGGH
jgi:hypothetical protein